MGTIEDVVMKVKDVAEAAGKKTADLVEISKLTLSIAETKEKIEKLYTDIGRIAFEALKAETDCTEEIKAKAAVIDELTVQMSQIKEKIAMLKSMKFCPVCNADNRKESLYCHKCGAKLDA